MGMIQQNKFSKIQKWVKSAVATAVLPVFLIYILIAKPDYYLMNGLAHIVLPVAHTVGDAITWPVRAGGRLVKNIGELSNLRDENELLKMQLADALNTKNTCDIVMQENKKLENELDLVRAQPHSAVIADIMFDNPTLHHNTFLINRGKNDGVAQGMVVVSVDGILAGVVMDVSSEFSRVRSLSDSNSNIAVRVVGTDVYAFLQGTGSGYAKIGMFSKPEFKPQDGTKLITSNISGVVPSGIFVGNIKNKSEVEVIKPNTISRVMVLKYDNKNKYK
ncbi:MAG: rod shape-determining protein MreC [Alphaproteobacteria bacterium]|nr:rod shape-determining protein MreC [Alphaproteobacteria bacterium]